MNKMGRCHAKHEEAESDLVYRRVLELEYNLQIRAALYALGIYDYVCILYFQDTENN